MIQSLLEKILNALESEDIPETVTELSLSFTDDNDIRELNRAYRGKDKATDVLSFSQLEVTDEEIEHLHPTILGDIVISLDTTKAQALELNVSFEDELKRLLIHGVLHLFGYDHENVSPEEKKRMEDKEEELFLLT